ncbi:MAG: pentapeptide repeat-containing protein [Vicinamibacterales bacterium]
MFLTGRLGDLTVHRAIECKVGSVTAEHIDAFLLKLRLVRNDYPAVLGSIVSATGFSSGIRAQAAREGIQLTLFRDLEAELFDGHSYVQALLKECESNERYSLSLYVEPSAGYEVSDESVTASSILDAWLESSDWNQLTFLGDVGTGKSFLTRRLAHRLALRFLEDPVANPVPVLVDLREADRAFSLEGLMMTHMARSGMRHVSFEAFQYSLESGHLILILDGFDEMAARVTPQITSRNFGELSRCIKARAKVLLTCRTHYFKSRTEEEEVVLGGSGDYGSETARELYWELIARDGFRIAYLRPFTISQIEQYVRNARGRDHIEALEKIRRTYNLMELSQRPMLLEMIVKSIDKLDGGQINQATLYAVYTDAWIHRDLWRDVLAPAAKVQFLTELAQTLWDEDQQAIHHTRLFEQIRVSLAHQIHTPQQLVEFDGELRTASFLTRDAFGNYGFAHKSYAEYFLARRLADRLNAGDVSALKIRRLTPEVIGFLRCLCDVTSCERLLEGTLKSLYQPFVSENALLLLYGIRRSVLMEGAGTSSGALSVPLPAGMKLDGARLDQVTLEGAVMMDSSLRDVNLDGAILANARFDGSVCEDATFTGADLRFASLKDTRLAGCKFPGAGLEGTDLSGAGGDGVDFSDAYLIGAISTSSTHLTGVRATAAVLEDELRRHFGLTLAPESEGSTTGLPSADDRVALDLYELVQSELQWWMVASGMDSEEVVQDIVGDLVLQGKLGKGRLEDRAWVRRSARAKFFRERWKASGAAAQTSPVSDAAEMPSENASPLDHVVWSEMSALINSEVSRWSPLLRRVYQSRFVDEMSIAAIASKERLSTQTVHRATREIRELLRRALKADA